MLSLIVDILDFMALLQVLVSTEDLQAGKTVEGWFPLINAREKELRGGGKLRIKVTYTDIRDNPLYGRGTEAEACFSAVQNSAFADREGNHVVMYQVCQHRYDTDWCMWPCPAAMCCRSA